jgi:hypothetical protein
MRWTVGPAIIWFAINDPVTWIGEDFFAVQRTDLFFRVLDLPHVGAQRIAADDSAISTSVNQRHFLGELLRDCGFFAHLVFRAVREANRVDPSSSRASGYKKSKDLRTYQTSPRSGRDVLRGRLSLGTLGRQAEEPRSLPQALWVEVGCRHAQMIVSGKVPYDYGENSDDAL